MGFTSEIYLTKKYVPKEDWLELIKVVSNYNGFFKKWKIIVINDKNQLRYYVKTRCSLPASLNNLNCFLFKQVEEIKMPKPNYMLVTLPKVGSSIIDLINYSEIKNKGILTYLEISFFKLYEGKIKTKIVYYLKKNSVVKKYKVLFAIPPSILSVDFDSNKRYFYRSSPKYLEINKVLQLLDNNSNNSLLAVDVFPYLQGEFYLKQNSFSFDKHSIIVGSSGSGKSKFLSLLINNIYKNEEFKKNYKVVVIDPHASLEDDIGGIGKVIDFKSSLDSMDLFINSSDDVVISTELLLDLLKSLIADQFNAKLERVLRYSIHLLLVGKLFNFKNLKKLILDLEYRNDLIKKLKGNLANSVVDFFLTDYNELKTKSYSEAIVPIISFIDEMDMLPIFNSDLSNENLKNTIDNNYLTLFSLDRTKLGDKVTKTISGLIMQQLFILMQKKEIEEHIIFIIDEVAIVENPILARYLAEARKYNLSLILAGQYFNQISEDLKNAIFANVINYFIFRVSKMDANVLVDNFNMKIPLDNSRESKIKLLSELNNRECIVRLEANGVLLPAFKGVTLDYKSIPRIKKIRVNEVKNVEKLRCSKTNFNLNTNVSLRDILIANSTNRRGV